MNTLVLYARYAEALLPLVTLAGAILAVIYIGYVLYQLLFPLRYVERKMNTLDDEAFTKLERAIKKANAVASEDDQDEQSYYSEMLDRTETFNKVLEIETKELSVTHSKIQDIHEAKRRRILEKLPLLKK